ncbi:MAG: TdeIII family type II restriction endonuclease [Treponema sp.]|nr:TdeIII family type II restriction endonuclease [Treponema sp.]
MDKQKENAIKLMVDGAITDFSTGFEGRYEGEVDDPKGVINSKKNNCFIAELGDEFMFYSAFVRSFDSSFGKVLENLGNRIASLSYEVRGKIDSFFLPQQSQSIDYLINEYEKHTKPQISDYQDINVIIPADTRSYARSHETDNYFYDPNTHSHYIIELKAGGDLDNKKSKAEKLALLQEYFILKNSLPRNSTDTIKIFFGTAYNMYGEGNEWKQERVRQFFAEEELLIGKDYWNFVCNDNNGFDIIFGQYKISCEKIKSSLERIKKMYFQGV